MSKKNRSVYNIKDFKGGNGEWVTTFCETTEKEYIQYWTRSFKLWVKINGRCSNGYILKERPGYASSENKFNSFQEFATWCNNQEGYNNKDPNGRFWSIDKDILSPAGLSYYSEDTCLFVPNDVNQFFKRKVDTGNELIVKRRIIKLQEYIVNNKDWPDNLLSALRRKLEDLQKISIGEMK